MIRLLIALFLLGWFLTGVSAQRGNPPLPRSVTQTKVTLAQTNVFVQIHPGGVTRSGCIIQNNGSHTMFVFFGGNSAPSDTTTSLQISGGSAATCGPGLGGAVGSDLTVSQDKVWLAGTANDVAVLLAW